MNNTIQKKGNVVEEKIFFGAAVVKYCDDGYRDNTPEKEQEIRDNINYLAYCVLEEINKREKKEAEKVAL